MSTDGERKRAVHFFNDKESTAWRFRAPGVYAALDPRARLGKQHAQFPGVRPSGGLEVITSVHTTIATQSPFVGGCIRERTLRVPPCAQ